MAMNDAFFRARRQRQHALPGRNLLSQPIVRQMCGPRNPPGGSSGNEFGPFISEREKAAWLKTQDRNAVFDTSSQIGSLLADKIAGVSQIAFAHQGPTTTRQTGQFHLISG